MPSVKELLYDSIELLSEKEARQLMGVVRILRNKKEISPTMKRLAVDATFKVPTRKTKAFRSVQPVKGKGIPASALLVEDRR